MAEEALPADDARMTTEQLNELGQALAILSAKSSVIQERDELRELIAEYQRENEDVCSCPRHTQSF